METAFVVGAGRVGTGLANVLPEAGVRVIGVWNRTLAGLRRSRRMVDAPAFHGALPPLISEADLVFLTVPDDAVAATCADAAPRFHPGQTVVHCAGGLDLSVLTPARDAGARVGSLHPLQAFADPGTAAEGFRGALGVVAGQPAVRRHLRELARGLGLHPAELADDAQARARYHAAAVSAAGHLVALMDLSLELAHSAGLPSRDALAGLAHLARGTLGHLERRGRTEAALTGPVARGDAGVLERQLAAMAALPPGTRSLYRALLQRQLEVAARRPDADAEACRRLELLLYGPDGPSR